MGLRQSILQWLVVIAAFPLTSSDWAPTGSFSGLDPEWDTYVEALHAEYEGFTYTTRKKAESTTDGKEDYEISFDWTLMSPGEVPFVAILYQPTKDDLDPTEVKPKRNCGGILVSVDVVVTSCGCIMTFMHEIFESVWVKRKRPIGGFRYDMTAVDETFNFKNVQVNRIYVVFSQAEFDGASKDHYLDEHVHFPKPECLTRTDPFWVLDGDPKTLDPRRVDAILTPWKMVPPIRYPIPGQFMPWPPKPITDLETLHNSTDATDKKDVVISGIGFIAKDKDFLQIDEHGKTVNFLSRGVNLVLEHCYSYTNECPKDIERDNVTCFCALRENKFELCGGTIGWPVINMNNAVVGLTASSRDCNEPHGSILVAVFTPAVAREVAAMAGTWKQLEDQNSMRPPLYREAPWLRKTPLYDYEVFDQTLSEERAASDTPAFLRSTHTLSRLAILLHLFARWPWF